MRGAENRRPAGQGHVDGVRGEALLETLSRERGVPSSPGCRELALERVATPTGDWSLVGREGSQTAEKERQLPLGTEKRPLPGDDLVERGCCVELSHRPRADVVDRLLRSHAVTCPSRPVSFTGMKKPLGRDEGPPRGTTLLRRRAGALKPAR